RSALQLGINLDAAAGVLGARPSALECAAYGEAESEQRGERKRGASPGIAGALPHAEQSGDDESSGEGDGGPEHRPRALPDESRPSRRKRDAPAKNRDCHKAEPSTRNGRRLPYECVRDEAVPVQDLPAPPVRGEPASRYAR